MIPDTAISPGISLISARPPRGFLLLGRGLKVNASRITRVLEGSLPVEGLCEQRRRVTPLQRSRLDSVSRVRGRVTECGGVMAGTTPSLSEISKVGFLYVCLCACVKWGNFVDAMGQAASSSASNIGLVTQLQKHGILTSRECAAAMIQIDRAHYVPPGGAPYDDSPQDIGFGVTISAPHMHGHCLSLLTDHLKPGNSVLDVGSGSGYLTAVLALLVGETGRTVGVEHIPELVERSINAIKHGPAGHLLDGGQLSIHKADGKLGYADAAPYDAIHVGAAAAELPEALLEQLKPGGRMVIPVGKGFQDLLVIDKLADGTIKQHSQMSVRYVPLI